MRASTEGATDVAAGWRRAAIGKPRSLRDLLSNDNGLGGAEWRPRNQTCFTMTHKKLSEESVRIYCFHFHRPDCVCACSSLMRIPQAATAMNFPWPHYGPDGASLPGAKITIAAELRPANTADASGAYTVSGLAAGTKYRLSAEYPGFASFQSQHGCAGQIRHRLLGLGSKWNRTSW